MDKKFIKQTTLMLSGAVLASFMGVAMVSDIVEANEVSRQEFAKKFEIQRKEEKEKFIKSMTIEEQFYYRNGSNSDTIKQDYPTSGMYGSDIDNTLLGKPHEITNDMPKLYLNSNPQYIAKWNFEDSMYKYSCNAIVFSLDSGLELVREFSVFARDKRTGNIVKSYIDSKSYDRNRESGRIECYDSNITNKF